MFAPDLTQNIPRTFATEIATEQAGTRRDWNGRWTTSRPKKCDAERR